MGTFITSSFTSNDATAPRVLPLWARDTFNRANSATAGSTEVGGFAWTHRDSTYNISGNVLSSGDTTSGTPADCWFDPKKTSGLVSVKITALGDKDHAGIIFRKASTGNTGIAFYAQAVGYRLAVRTGADAFTVLDRNGAPVSWAAGQTAQVEWTPTRIICSVDGVVTHDVANTTYATQTGVGLETRLATAANPAKWDDFILSPG